MADPDISTPLAWFYAGFLILVIAFAWFALVLRCMCSMCKACACCPNRVRDSAPPMPRGCGLCCIVIYVFFLVFHSLWLLTYTSVAPCVRGFPNWSGGGICTCDKREPLHVHGSPRYASEGVVPAGLKIAYIGDTDTVNVVNIYRLIRSENVSAVVLNGDLDYKGSPAKWNLVYKEVLGDLPFYVTVGNHDNHIWRDYQDQVSRHYSASNVTECVGNVGVREVCTHAGVAMLLSGAGSACGGLTHEHTPYISQSLQQFQEWNVTWKVCNFHKNNHLLHTSRMPSVMKDVDEVGLDNFRLCLQHGAMIFTSHKHQYSRTHEIDAMSSETVSVSRRVPVGSNSSNPIRLGRGRSFVVVNGIGGYSIHTMDRGMLANEWWAAHWDGGGRSKASPADVSGAFFCEYHVMGDPRLARCYFKNVRGDLIDDFYIRAEE